MPSITDYLQASVVLLVLVSVSVGVGVWVYSGSADKTTLGNSILLFYSNEFIHSETNKSLWVDSKVSLIWDWFYNLSSYIKNMFKNTNGNYTPLMNTFFKLLALIFLTDFNQFIFCLFQLYAAIQGSLKVTWYFSPFFFFYFISSTRKAKSNKITKLIAKFLSLFLMWKITKLGEHHVLIKELASCWQLLSVSVLLYGYTTWTLMKHAEEKLVQNYTKML